jgi:hypothetical protein
VAAAWRSKWLDWQPGDKNISTSPTNELTKLNSAPSSVSFVSSNLGVSQNISASEHTPTASENIFVSPETELTELTKLTPERTSISSVSFVSTNSGNDEIISAPEHDPEAWRSDFSLWMYQNCVCREGYDDSGGIRFLWDDFNDWAIAHNSVPCLRSTFERLLVDAGFELRDSMVLGLVLREDLKIWQEMNAATSLPPAPARSVIRRPRRRRSW